MEKLRGSKPGIVLSGGGMHGAYEVGILAGIFEALGQRASDPALFEIFTGTSAGSFNATYLASKAHHGDHDIEGLIAAWKRFEFKRFMRLHPSSLLPVPHWLRKKLGSDVQPQAGGLLDSSEVEQIVTETVDWSRLHTNSESGKIVGLVVTALHALSGRMVHFSETAPDVHYNPSGSRGRLVHRGRIYPEHVFASGAIPGVFRAQNVDGHYFCDGGIECKTPISPALRLGADRIVVVTLEPGDPDHASRLAASDLANLPPEDPPGAGSFLGKVLGSLLHDNVDHDLIVLERYSRLAQVLDETLSPEQRQTVASAMEKYRGAPFRLVPTMVFKPKEDFGKVGAAALKRYDTSQLSTAQRALLHWLGPQDENDSAWASFLFFDGGYAADIIDLGRQDALARKDQLEEFFSGDNDRASILV